MADNHLDRALNHQSTGPYAYEYDRLTNVVNAQLFGVTEMLGAGIVDHGWEVTASTGLSVTIAAGSGVISTSNGYVYHETTATTSVGTAEGLADDSDNYLYVETVEESAYWDPDSRDDATPAFHVYSTGGDRLGALPLAKVVTAGGVVTSVTDLRTDISLTDFDDRLDVLETWQTTVESAIGSDYFGASPPSSVDDRLDALETGGGGGTSTVYWGALERTSSDTTTIQQAIDAGDAATLAAAQADNTAQIAAENWDEDAVNTLETVVRLVHLAPEFAATADGVNDRYRTIVLVPGLVGHLAIGDANGIIDESASDMSAVDFMNHRFG